MMGCTIFLLVTMIGLSIWENTLANSYLSNQVVEIGSMSIKFDDGFANCAQLLLSDLQLQQVLCFASTDYGHFKFLNKWSELFCWVVVLIDAWH